MGPYWEVLKKSKPQTRPKTSKRCKIDSCPKTRTWQLISWIHWAKAKHPLPLARQELKPVVGGAPGLEKKPDEWSADWTPPMALESPPGRNPNRNPVTSYLQAVMEMMMYACMCTSACLKIYARACMYGCISALIQQGCTHAPPWATHKTRGEKLLSPPSKNPKSLHFRCFCLQIRIDNEVVISERKRIGLKLL